MLKYEKGFGTIHDSEWFLPWNRWYLNAIETLLQNIDCRVTLPFYRSSRLTTTWQANPPWKDEPDWFGENSFGDCVNTGPFKSWNSTRRGCLKRDFNGIMPTALYISAIMTTNPTEFVEFSDTLMFVINNGPHVRIGGYTGGTMSQTFSSNAPEFLIHHAFIDQIWSRYQKLSKSHLNSYYNAFYGYSAMPYTVRNVLPSDVNDLKGVKYRSRMQSTLRSCNVEIAF
jgi:hypothetical protein